LKTNRKILSSSFLALGVVYGDIGTSPLYALRESLSTLPITLSNILGILSLIFWSLVLIISVKYLHLILKADNDGEGGVLALLSLLKRKQNKFYPTFFVMGIIGAGMLMGDAMLTPAISVLSAVEGLQLIAPHLTSSIIPITLIILSILFLIQHKGTNIIGKYFAPIVLLWFITIGALGLQAIIHNPVVLQAINFTYAINFFIQNGKMSFILLGGVFLVVTGGEASYADLGHFSKTPIFLSWYAIVLPSLLLNYFGQGAYLLTHPLAITNPFYALAPLWFAYPLLILATLTTVIASQAVISASFSLIKQAVFLNLYPRLTIIYTSISERGQIYVPQMNRMLFVGTILLVIIFKHSENLVQAYGIAVNFVMLGATIMVSQVAYTVWHWSKLKVGLVFSVFLLIDLLFLHANLYKISQGAWFPLMAAGCYAFIMFTWNKGIEYVRTYYYMEKKELKNIITELDVNKANYLVGSTAIFIADPYDKSGGSLLYYLKLSNIMPEQILLLNIAVEQQPFMPVTERYELEEFNKGVYRLILHYGFQDSIDIPKDLKLANERSLFTLPFDVNTTTYFLEIVNIKATPRKKTLSFFWQENLFSFLMRNATLDIDFYHLPYERTLAIGSYCEI